MRGIKKDLAKLEKNLTEVENNIVITNSLNEQQIDKFNEELLTNAEQAAIRESMRRDLEYKNITLGMANDEMKKYSDRQKEEFKQDKQAEGESINNEKINMI